MAELNEILIISRKNYDKLQSRLANANEKLNKIEHLFWECLDNAMESVRREKPCNYPINSVRIAGVDAEKLAEIFNVEEEYNSILLDAKGICEDLKREFQEQEGKQE